VQGNLALLLRVWHYPTAFAKGLKKTMKALIKKTQALYTSDEIPWVIGYSGGKDSTTYTQIEVW